MCDIDYGYLQIMRANVAFADTSQYQIKAFPCYCLFQYKTCCWTSKRNTKDNMLTEFEAAIAIDRSIKDTNDTTSMRHGDFGNYNYKRATSAKTITSKRNKKDTMLTEFETTIDGSIKDTTDKNDTEVG